MLPLTSLQRIVLLLLMMAVLSPVNNPLVAKARTPVPAAYRTAPNFSRMDLNHGQVNLVNYRGKVVLLNFWATWCAPCLAEMPHYVAWQHEYGGRGLQVIGISMDDEEQPVRIAYREYRLNYPVVMGDETIGEMYGGVLGLPVTFLIDTKGKIRFKHQGAVDLNRLQNEIQTLLPRQ